MKNYYAVRVGYHPGIYTELEEAKDEVLGYSCAQWKGFARYRDAEEYMDEFFDDEEDYEDANFYVFEDGIYNYGRYCEPFDYYEDAKHEVLQSYDEVFYYVRKDLSYVDEDGDTVYMVYTDGACVRNGQEDAISGIGVYFGDNNPLNVSTRVHCGPQTSQRAELAAIKRAYKRERSERL